ncbi:MAG: ABC transporter ATP-binding protein [Acidimicrobiia bacterium]
MMALLEVDDITKHFAGVEALRGASLRVDEGEIVGLIGPNGAGKTTLLNIIHGFTAPTSGSVRFDGTSVTRHSAARRSRAGIGRTFQTLQLFGSLTVEENLRVAAARACRGGHAASHALTTARVCGVDGIFERRAADLPLGEGRRVELARALCLQPRLLLLDEPVSGMSDTATDDMARLILDLREQLGLAVLFIDHDMRFVMDISDYVYVADFGEIVAHGDPDAVRADPEVMRAYVGDLL